MSLRVSVVVGAFVVGAVALASCGVDDEPAVLDQARVEPGELTPIAPIPSTTTTTAPPTSTVDDASTTTAAPTTTTTTTISTDRLDRIDLDLELLATFTEPVGLTSRRGSDDLFVIEKSGRVIRLPDGRAEGADTTLDLRGVVSRGGEQGLLGLVFSPDGQRLYANYTDSAGDTQVSRWDMAGTVASIDSKQDLISVDQPRGNHNGGQLAFGPDGYLYIGLGDGGGGGDPLQHGQNPNTLHGSILRIDVDTDEGYTVPADNPFVSGDAPEVFVWGVRNAWRFGFDSATGDLWIGDVGQDRFEEVNVLRTSDGGGNGANLGWNKAEGLEPYRRATIPDDHVPPVLVYGQTNGRCSVTGGEVYRGADIPILAGTYVYGDFCTGEVFGYRVNESADPARLQLPSIDQLSSFGLDGRGEVYAISLSGGVFRIVEG